MNSYTSPFNLPITVPAIPTGENLVELSCAQSRTSALEIWNHAAHAEAGSGPMRIGVLGCQDGSFFLFHQSPPNALAVSTPTIQIRNTRRSTHSSLSFPTSPTFSSSAPFHVTPRSRVVAGVTTEKVEAPKVYVDFDDEPDKLKGLLQGRSPRDRSTTSETDSIPAYSDRAFENVNHKSQEQLKGIRSKTTSPLYSPKSPPTPPSPQDNQCPNPCSSQKMALIAHVISRQGGVGCAVKSIVPIQHGRLFAILQESGDVCVYSSQDGYCLASAHVDELPLQPPRGIKDKEYCHDTYIWSILNTVELGESILLLATASIEANASSMQAFEPEDVTTDERSKAAIFQFTPKGDVEAFPSKLAKACQWTYSGFFEGLAMSVVNEESVALFSISSSGKVTVRRLKTSSEVRPAGSGTHTPTSNGVGTTALPLPNPFKAMKWGHTEKSQTPQTGEGAVNFSVDEEQVLGEFDLEGLQAGTRIRRVGHQHIGLLWTASSVMTFSFHDSSFRILSRQHVTNVIKVDWIDDVSYYVVYHDRVEYFKLQSVGEKNGPGLSPIKHFLQSVLCTESFKVLAVPSPYEVIYVKDAANGCRQLVYAGNSESPTNKNEKQLQLVLWQSAIPNQDMTCQTSLLPLDIDVIIQGYADGFIRQSSLSHLSNVSEDMISCMKASDSHLNGNIIFLDTVQNPRTRERYLLSGACDGSIAFWTINTFQLCARWTVFTIPLSQAVQLSDIKIGPLRECMLCISGDGTIAVIAIDGFQFLFIIPGSSVPLRRICSCDTNVMLIYGDRRVRLWDAQTREFWRSLSLDKAEELLSQGGWAELFLDKQEDINSLLKVLSDYRHGLDSDASLSLDLERFISESITVTKTISTNLGQTKAIFTTLDRLRLVLSFVLTPGLNEEIDMICREKLKISSSSITVGLSSSEKSALYPTKGRHEPWCISGRMSAVRAVAIVGILRALSLFEEYQDSAKTVTMFYVASLANYVGPQYQSPDLTFLASAWFRSSVEMRQSCRTVFDASIARLSDDEAGTMIEQWQHQLPCSPTNMGRDSAVAALALYLCGYLAVEKYSIMSIDSLRVISKSISLFLHDDQPTYKILAVDLCSRGFHVWQHYVDAMEILRALFTLATNTRKDSISVQNVGVQARSAVLHIASSNTPLFMTTLGLDILNPPNLEHRRSVLQIVAFLIRKRPLVLQPNLPRLMEAVVKSLDPNSNGDREAVIDTATEIIGQVVKTFPNVDFHGTTQRLAVGSNEGAIVMYDLKTAIRLYVLEGHKKRIAACSFSPDGRRLVTLSLDESVVLVWKVGSSFASFFNPGAPPRQGHGGSEPYKTLNFNVGDISRYSSSLDSVQFEWVADRSVKVKIGQNTLSFST
ncbi:hypothetical protein AMATHDRAFT_815 [Amanita thiersii Skay4041]|uniref:Uncharacterized protein n=1 Tax=Amanita thiersii Skay4041 TaxID=703135 RepID=A0A2A9P0S9_9AGAR|nr:hypothetical protein AMATHDRAFT_815 [Amanita thiersii Skay4041]